MDTIGEGARRWRYAERTNSENSAEKRENKERKNTQSEV
jgi:hypothetical protein